jgi:tetratricopeptide (TPR) repeat protein
LSDGDTRDGSHDAAERHVDRVLNDLSGTVTGPSIQARSIHGGIQFNARNQSSTPIPAQLPSQPFFANRHKELADLDRLIEQNSNTSRPSLVVITGAGGVGKTTLGLHWLHRQRDEYTDGQLFVDLRGFSNDARPMRFNEPLERFLRALGIDTESMPIDPDEQAALYRSATAGRRLIIMLDNAVSAAQVRPLLPGPGRAIVLVTTRQRLSGLALEGARFLNLHPMDEYGAVELLDYLVGSDRIRAEPDEARSLVSLCGRLPIAVCASGARLATRRHWTIARIVAELTDETGRLSALNAEEDVSVKAVFDLSYRALSDDAKRLYRLLALHPGADFDAAAAAAIAELNFTHALDLLDDLAGSNLLQEGPRDRYHFHDLLRLHARQKLHEAESKDARHAYFNRMTDWYLKTAVAADLTVQSGRWHLGSYYDYYTIERQTSFDSREAAFIWLEVELTNLTALAEHAHAEGFHETAWQLVESLWNLFLFRKHYRVWIESHQLGLDAARACGDLRAQARMLEGLGFAYLNLKDFPAAISFCRQALQLEQDTGHRIGEASALEGLGIAELAGGHSTRAIDLFTQAQDINQQLGHSRGVALMRRHLGEAFTEAHRYNEAIKHLTDALQFFIRSDELYHQTRTLNHLAEAYLRAGRIEDAERSLRTALTTSQQAGARHEHANVHVTLARLAIKRNESGTAQDHLHQALAIYSDLGAPQAAEVGQWLTKEFPESLG